jgi:TonB family protein
MSPSPHPLRASFWLALGLVLAASPLHAQKIDPKVINAPSPGYPSELTDSGLSGSAEVDIVVKADGTVADARLAMANHRAFGRVALAAISTWQFQPASLDGRPVDAKVSVPFRFQAPLDQQVNAAVKRKVFIELPEAALSQKDYGSKLKVKKAARNVYPRSLAGTGIEEDVKVSFIVAPDGTTFNPTIVGKPHSELILPALQAIATTTYEPPLKNGKPVYVEATTSLTFNEERRGEGGGGRGGGGGGGGRGGGGGGRGGGGGGF